MGRTTEPATDGSGRPSTTVPGDIERSPDTSTTAAGDTDGPTELPIDGDTEPSPSTSTTAAGDTDGPTELPTERDIEPSPRPSTTVPGDTDTSPSTRGEPLGLGRMSGRPPLAILPEPSGELTGSVTSAVEATEEEVPSAAVAAGATDHSDHKHSDLLNRL